MFNIILEKQKEPKNILAMVGFFSLFMVIYTLLDHLNGGYNQIIMDHGFYLVLLNVGLNVIMSLMSALMFTMSAALLKLTGSDGKGSNATLLSLFFGMFTYGCAPCLIAFFAAIGITLSVTILPLAGFPYKLLAFVILILGALYLIHEMKHSKCKIKGRKQDDA